MRFNYYIGKGCFLTGHSEKGYQFQNVEQTVKSKFCGPLFTHRYTVDQQAPPPPPTGECSLGASFCLLCSVLFCFVLFCSVFVVVLFFAFY